MASDPEPNPTRSVDLSVTPAWHATVFVTHLRHHDAPAPLAEIAEQRWLGLDEDLPDDLAPLLRNHVVPSLRARLATR